MSEAERDEDRAEHRQTDQEILRRLQNLTNQFENHIIEEKRWHETVMEAFPSGDFDGHRRAHEAMIKAAEAQEEFWRDLKLDLAKKGAWFLLSVIAGLVVVGIAAKFGLWPHK